MPQEAPDASTTRSCPARFSGLQFQRAAGFGCGGMMPQAIAVCRDSKWAQLCTRCEADFSSVALTCPQHPPMEVSSLYRHRLDTGHSRANAHRCQCDPPAMHSDFHHTLPAFNRSLGIWTPCKPWLGVVLLTDPQRTSWRLICPYWQWLLVRHLHRLC